MGKSRADEGQPGRARGSQASSASSLHSAHLEALQASPAAQEVGLKVPTLSSRVGPLLSQAPAH